MKERYAFRYNEFLIQKQQKIFDVAGSKNPLLDDIKARFEGVPFTDGISPLLKLGVCVKQTHKDLEKLLPLTDVYGADAVRLALIENMPLTDENLTGCWRFVGNFWRYCQTQKKNLLPCFEVIHS